MKTVKIDKTDLQILKILQEDGRITNLQLSNEIGLSPAPTLERVRKLERHNMIQSYHASVNASALGLGIQAFIQVALARQRDDEIIEFSGCLRYIDTPVKRYSSGMTVRLAFAVAAHLEPDILVIDEVLAVGDAEFQKKAIGKMQDMSSGEGRTVLFVSHNMAAVKSLCTRAFILENGKKTLEGRVNTVVDYYLNESKTIIHKTRLIDDSFRRLKNRLDLQVTKLTLLNDTFTIKAPIIIRVHFKINRNIEKFRISGTLLDCVETAIGSFFTEEIRLDENISKNFIDVIIRNHNLSPGIYFVNISIGEGNPISGNIRDYDGIYCAISFEIDSVNKKGELVSRWVPQWGKSYYDATILKG